jgi:diguanylate cyclase (GGDEF)-like protein
VYLRFWGTRGSIAAPGWQTASYGGNTSCVEVRAGDGTIIVLDCGTGVRELGLHLLRHGPKPLRLHVFIGHTHWDHIQGFPFFAPAFMPGVEVNIHAPLGFQKSLGEAMAGQMESAYFPVKLKELRSRIHFTELDEGFFRVGDVLVETQYVNHTAPTIAYRLTNGSTTIAYVTDHEPFWVPGGEGFVHPGDQRHIAFLRGADLVIHDAQYTGDEYRNRVGWGHSPIEYAIDVALEAGVPRLALFHHDPAHDDITMERLEAQARARVAAHGGTLDVFAAREGRELELKGQGQFVAVAQFPAVRRCAIAGRRVALIGAAPLEIAAIEGAMVEDSLVLLTIAESADVMARIRQIAPDLVIISTSLGSRIDGASLIAPIRTALARPDCPVVLITDNDDPAYHADLATDYLARPFSPPMLRSRVRAWLSRVVAADEAKEACPDPNPVMTGAPLGQQAGPDAWAAVLAGTPLFRRIGTEQLRRLCEGAIDEVYGPGHVIIREGTAANNVFVVLSGRVRVVERARDTDSDVMLSELRAGEVFGELAILQNEARHATVIALDRTHCLMLRPDRFTEALNACPPLALGLVHVLAARLTDADRRLARYAPDTLTGLMGRREFNEEYRRLTAAARRRGTGALLVLLDIIGLNAINDRHGYAIGDAALQAAAEALIDATRSTDAVARHGGDEFAVLMVDVEPADLPRVLTRMKVQLTQTATRRLLPVDVRWSLGGAFAAVPPDEPDALLREADADVRRRRAEG